jgi:hypothetical protein
MMTLPSKNFRLYSLSVLGDAIFNNGRFPSDGKYALSL